MRKSYKQVRETLSIFAKASSKSSQDMKRFYDSEARLLIFLQTESTSARIGYTEFYRNELERLEVKKTGLGSRAADGLLNLLGEVEEESPSS